MCLGKGKDLKLRSILSKHELCRKGKKTKMNQIQEALAECEIFADWLKVTGPLLI
jgi:hypothetical protein